MTDGNSASVVVPDLAAAAVSEKPATVARVPSAPSSFVSSVPWIVLGGSAAFAGLGVAGLLEHDKSVSDYNANPTCPAINAATRPAPCDDLVSSANTWKTVAVVGFVASGVALAGAVTLWLAMPSQDGRGRAAIRCAAGLGAVACSGVF